MNSFRWFKKLAILPGRKRFLSDLDEEMTFHREQAESEFPAGGMTPQAASQAAKRQFGNMTSLRGTEPRSSRVSHRNRGA